MKKIATVLFLVLILSCSTNNDSNGNSNTTVVPVAPTNLAGTAVSPTQIDLSWTDNSTNETGFKIERRTGTGNYVLVGTVNADILTYSNLGLTAATNYIYRVYSYNVAGNSPTYSNEVIVTTTATVSLPTLTTTAVSSIANTTAVSGGTITTDGGAVVTARGVCWSTSPNPTIALTTKTTNGAGTGAFTSNITGLTANTIYYVRAYATNGVGTAYGNQVSFTSLQNSTGINIAGANVTDIDGNTYQSISNCGLTFTKQNLNVSMYSDGTPIPQVTDPTQWVNLTIGAWCYQSNSTAFGTTYGKLYNWYAVAGIYDAVSAANPALRKKLAPIGWHVPSDSEWTQLTDCLGGESVAGGKMRSTGTSLWPNQNAGATNESGFTGLPGGYRFGANSGLFESSAGLWWSSSESNTTTAWNRMLFSGSSSALRDRYSKKDGLSVRCVKD